MSPEAGAVLTKMRGGYFVVGFIGDYGRPLRLQRRGGETWENVEFSNFIEMLNCGAIQKAVEMLNGQEVYKLSEEPAGKGNERRRGKTHKTRIYMA